MADPYKVGLTGGIGCGKSAAAAVFSRLGVPVVDADDIVRELTRPGAPATGRIAAAFGGEVLDEAGALKRDRLRERVFADPAARQKLENILHPLVYAAMHDRVRGLEAPYCVLSIPLLVETAAPGLVDRTLVIDCPVELQVQRVVTRDGVEAEQVMNIIRTQASRERRLEAADDVVSNDADLGRLERDIHRLHQKYLRLSKKSD